MDKYGFIITRHVNSDKTNKYWNQCVKLIRTFLMKVGKEMTELKDEFIKQELLKSGRIDDEQYKEYLIESYDQFLDDVFKN